MQGLKTKSFFEGENRMTFDVAGQQLTATEIGHPFLHLEDTGGNQPISAKTGQNRVRLGHLRNKGRRDSVTLSQFRRLGGVTAGQREGQDFPRWVTESSRCI